jgi:ubiquinone biosynthesis protein COQ4
MSKPTSIIDADMSLSFTPELLQGLQSFLSLINEEFTVEGIFDIDEALATQEVTAAEIAYVKSNPEIAQLFEERYIAPTPNLEELIKLPKDSLGFTYASYMRELNFEQKFYPEVEVKDDVSYFTMRMRQTHDIWHTVTGWFNDAGGIKLAAFTVAQNRSALNTLSLAAVLLHKIKRNEDINPIIHLLYDGYNLGCQTKPFLAQKWEEAWEKPVADWRSELNFYIT